MPQLKLKHAKQQADGALGDLHVNMSNALIRMAHGLTLAEKRVVCVCLAKMDSVRLESGRYKFRIEAAEYAETFGVTLDMAYIHLTESGNKLMDRKARAFVMTPKGKEEIKFVWVSGSRYHRGEGWIELGFSPEITPHLALLRREFTSYKLKHTSALRSIYSWRLFELMAQFKDTGLLRIDIAEFCDAMEVPPTARANFGELSRRVIAPAVKELTEKNGLLINWEGTKPGGRKIQGLEFKFKDNPQTDLFGERPPTEPIFPEPKPKQKLLSKSPTAKVKSARAKTGAAAPNRQAVKKATSEALEILSRRGKKSLAED